MLLGKHVLTPLATALPGLACAWAALAADQLPAQPYPWPWWHGMPGMGFWWIFPLLCFAMFVFVLIFLARRGGMACMGHRRHGEDRPAGEPRESALDILNKRYAKGEIDRPEYEQKKADIAAVR